MVKIKASAALFEVSGVKIGIGIGISGANIWASGATIGGSGVKIGGHGP